MRDPANRMTTGVPSHRCVRCRLPHAACLCDLIPRVETRTRVVLVLHQLEDCKTSNTGRLALRCLPNGEIIIRGDARRARAGGASDSGDRLDARPGAPGGTPANWAAHGDPVLLFPHPDARPLESWRDHPRPITLIVPDGTWRQGQRVRHRMPGLADVPCASIARDAPSTYRLRTTADPRRLATLEAIAEALGILEGAAPREALLRIFDVMVERSLRNRAGGV
jgi:DTW domain-containing protein YfiP